MSRIIHTADIHLGKRFHFLGDFGHTVREQIKASFVRTLELARRCGAAAVVEAGDLFDLRPDKPAQRFVLDAIRRAGLPVILLPGTHDRLERESVYHEWKDRPANLHILGLDERTTIRIPEAGLAIHGRANTVQRGGEPPLRGIHPDPEARFNVVLAHASVERGDIQTDPDDEYVVNAAAIEATGATYCALGHWHRCAEALPGCRVPTWYSGPPEPVQFEGGADSGFALEVQLAAPRAEVVPHRIGRYHWKEAAIDAGPFQQEAEVRAALAPLGGPDVVARVRLTGALASTAAFESEAVAAALQGQFAFLDLDTSGLRTRWEEAVPEAAFPPGTIGAAFVRLAQERRAAAGAAQRGHYDEVLRRGVALLSGREAV